MKDMARAKEKKKNQTMLCCPAEEEDDTPKYPYGLRISMCDESLKKLGINELPALGAKFTLRAVCEVDSTSQYQEKDGADRTLGLQITAMELDSGTAPTPVDQLYGS